ncbi:hypothetical protein F4814DRAFT_329046 [Daldinia grandis]|nr:hypothetical protein F4814DRAFT_329046 [Daldinia grandis]
MQTHSIIFFGLLSFFQGAVASTTGTYPRDMAEGTCSRIDGSPGQCQPRGNGFDIDHPPQQCDIDYLCTMSGDPCYWDKYAPKGHQVICT